MKSMKNMRYQILIICSILYFLPVHAQVGIGNTDPRGAVDINEASGTNTQGLVLPSNDDDLIVAPGGGTPVEGTIIYDTEDDCVKYYNGTEWSPCLGVPQSAFTAGQVCTDRNDVRHIFYYPGTIAAPTAGNGLVHLISGFGDIWATASSDLREAIAQPGSGVTSGDQLVPSVNTGIAEAGLIGIDFKSIFSNAGTGDTGYTIALTDDGDVYTWGANVANTFGSMNNTTAETEFIPVQINGSLKFSQMYYSVSEPFVALREATTGEVYFYGNQGGGRFNGATTGNYTTLTNISAFLNYGSGPASILDSRDALIIGDNSSGYTFFIASDGKVYSMRNNNSGPPSELTFTGGAATTATKIAGNASSYAMLRTYALGNDGNIYARANGTSTLNFATDLNAELSAGETFVDIAATKVINDGRWRNIAITNLGKIVTWETSTAAFTNIKTLSTSEAPYSELGPGDGSVFAVEILLKDNDNQDFHAVKMNTGVTYLFTSEGGSTASFTSGTLITSLAGTELEGSQGYDGSSSPGFAAVNCWANPTGINQIVEP